MDADSASVEVDPGAGRGSPHYEVELSQPGRDEQGYLVDAFTGELLSGGPIVLSSDPAEHEQNASGGGSIAGIGPDQARDAALTHAGISEGQVSGLQVQQDWDDGRLGMSRIPAPAAWNMRYTIDGSTGQILEYDQEQGD